MSGTGSGPPPWPGGAAWIDGRYCPVEDARISVLDLGVTRSDCTYDVVHVWPVGTGAPGPLTLRLRDRYWASHQDPRCSTPVRYAEPGCADPASGG